MMNKTIELNEQQSEIIKAMMEEVIDGKNLEGDASWSKTSKAIAQQIINKLEE